MQPRFLIQTGGFFSRSFKLPLSLYRGAVVERLQIGYYSMPSHFL